MLAEMPESRMSGTPDDGRDGRGEDRPPATGERRQVGHWAARESGRPGRNTPFAARRMVSSAET